MLVKPIPILSSMLSSSLPATHLPYELFALSWCPLTTLIFSICSCSLVLLFIDAPWTSFCQLSYEPTTMAEFPQHFWKHSIRYLVCWSCLLIYYPPSLPLYYALLPHWVKLTQIYDLLLLTIMYATTSKLLFLLLPMITVVIGVCWTA